MSYITFSQDYVCSLTHQWVKDSFSSELKTLLKNKVSLVSRISDSRTQEVEIAFVLYLPCEADRHTLECDKIVRALIIELEGGNHEIDALYLHSHAYCIQSWGRDRKSCDK